MYQLECARNLCGNKYIAFLLEQFELRQILFRNKCSVNIRENAISASELIEELRTPLEGHIVTELDSLIEMDASSHRNWLGQNTAILKENYVAVIQITFKAIYPAKRFVLISSAKKRTIIYFATTH